MSEALSGTTPDFAESPQVVRARAELARGIRKVLWGLGLMVALGVLTESMFLVLIGFLVLLDGVGRVAAASLHPANRGAVGSLRRSLRRLYRLDTHPQDRFSSPSIGQDSPASVIEHTTFELQEPILSRPDRNRART
ncbi:MAG: hypothetical protein D6723_12835 [Acidobacteria bacterium]|nr:MAG: hypothetical protein D6723_12835 [Acidobacteriota bacterium]